MYQKRKESVATKILDKRIEKKSIGFVKISFKTLVRVILLEFKKTWLGCGFKSEEVLRSRRCKINDKVNFA